MSKRDELISKLTAIQQEFKGFPEEQTIKDTIDELKPLNTDNKTVRVTDMLRAAQQLGRYCHGRSCSDCVFNSLSCPPASLRYEITDEILAEHEGEIVEIYDDD